MAWTPTLPAEPRSDRWWHDRWIYQQEAAAADARRAERIERLRARRREIDMKLADVLAADLRDRIDVRSQWRPRQEEIEHSQHVGRVLSVR